MEDVIVPHVRVGHEIKKWLVLNGYTRQEAYSSVGMGKSCFNAQLNKDDLRTDFVLRCSTALETNFFMLFWGGFHQEGTRCPLGEVHIGRQVAIRMQLSDKNQKWLADQLGTTQSWVSDALKRETWRTDMLEKASKALKHNFFADFYTSYSDQQMASYGYDALKRKIRELEKELSTLKETINK